jgi:hypothetical protein
VAHALGLPIDEGALRVGSTEDVGTRTFTVWSLVRLWTDAELSRTAECISRTVVVLGAGLDADACQGIGWVRDRA